MPRPPERFRDEPAEACGPLRPSPGPTGSPRPPRQRAPPHPRAERVSAPESEDPASPPKEGAAALRPDPPPAPAPGPDPPPAPARVQVRAACGARAAPDQRDPGLGLGVEAVRARLSSCGHNGDPTAEAGGAGAAAGPRRRERPREPQGGPHAPGARAQQGDCLVHWHPGDPALPVCRPGAVWSRHPSALFPGAGCRGGAPGGCGGPAAGPGLRPGAGRGGGPGAVCQQRPHRLPGGLRPGDADGLHRGWRAEAGGQPGQHRHAHRGKPGRPHHALPAGCRQQLLLQTQRQPVPDTAGLRRLRGAHPRLRPRRQAEPPRCEDPQVRLVPHRPGDARQQPRGPYLEQDPVPAAVQRHGRLCSHHVWRWWQPGGHSDQPDLHVPAPVEHARGPAPLDEKMLARPVLHVLQLRNQRHVGPRPAAARGAWPLGLLLRRLPARKPVGPERQDLRAPVPAGGSGPGDGPAAPGGRGGPAGVAAGPGPGRPLHPVPHGAGRPAGHWPAGALLPRPPAAGDWGAAGRPPGPGAWTLLGARETPPSHPRDPTQLLWPDPRAGQPLPSTHGARGDGALSPQGRPPPSSGDRPAPPFCSQCL
ncbi:solute carrier family 41 member 3 isoform X1 [Cervus canadensis]|uniref:solute carrier family 41 member 3 isoform X1 n=1 Tax=Cervus canadensis TaxID=1574408 RepID=UPI001CA31947|nr:solute carrier family 41 member 3 isoform X1 [Cervus canadensis]XP_043298689.1 solute carrier family 41 member 3 isoform X1 [Cervus canadensis]